MTLPGGRIAWSIHRFAVVTSTMDVAAAFARDGAPEGTVISAGRQTSGRGRAGRTWEDPGVALQATILLRPSLVASRLTLAPLLFGVAAAEAIETVCPDARVWLKWPNDLWLGARNDGRKTGGILVEMKAGGVMLAGFGINLDFMDFPREAAPPGATSLRAEGFVTNEPDLLAALLACIEARYRPLIESDGRVPLGEWLARAALLGERVSVVNQGEPRAGRFIGIRDDGALMLVDDAGDAHAVVAGDLVRGPRRAGFR